MHAKMTMLIGLVLFALFALPAFATQDFITRDAYEVLRKSGVANGVTKTVVYAKNKLGGVIPCGETCFGGTCYTPGCSCVWPVCTRNSLEEIKTSNFNLEETLVSYPKSKLGGVIPCGETCFGGTCYTPGCTCIWPVCTRETLLRRPRHPTLYMPEEPLHLPTSLIRK